MLVAIEGIDGSGKATVTKRLGSKIKNNGKRTETVSFPMYDRTLYGKLVGRYLNGDFGTSTHPYLHGTLYALDRFEARPWLLSQLATNDVVLLDRYIPSNICYSAMKATSGQEEEVVQHFVELEYGIFKMPVPDFIFFLDVPVHFALVNITQKEARGYTDKILDLHEADGLYLSRVRSFYMSKLMNFHPKTNFKTVDCVFNGQLKTIDSIVESIYDVLFTTERLEECVKKEL